MVDLTDAVPEQQSATKRLIEMASRLGPKEGLFFKEASEALGVQEKTVNNIAREHGLIKKFMINGVLRSVIVNPAHYPKPESSNG